MLIKIVLIKKHGNIVLIDILKELFSLLPYSCSIFVFNGYYREFKEDSWDTCFYILDNQEWNFISTLIFYYFNVFYSLDLLYDSLDTCGEEKVLGILLWVYFRCFRNSIFVLMMFICYSVFFLSDSVQEKYAQSVNWLLVSKAELHFCSDWSTRSRWTFV